MKLHADNKPVTRGSTQDETQFTIKATAKAFSILSSSLYSDKILAPIRELACNAYDAHVAAGNTATPIEIKLPNALDPTFHVKDFGIGLDHDGVMKLYTTYFDSTKTESDEYIGALGLGSKSPFAYTGNFNVESRFNGIKRLYAAFISEAGVPALTQMCDPMATDEPNGLTVSFSVRRGDESKFVNAARKALMYFDPKPMIIGYTGFEAHSLKHTLHGTNWAMRSSAYSASMTGAWVVQGFVAYPIDRSILIEHGLSDTAATVSNTNVDLFVNIGDVEIAPSREALSYDARTIKVLIERLEEAAKEMRTAIQQQFDACPNMWAARVLFSTYTDTGTPLSAVFSPLHQKNSFTYKGAELSRKMHVSLTTIKHTTITGYRFASRLRKVERTGQWTPTGSSSSTFAFEVQESLSVLVDDVCKGSSAVIEEYLREQMRKNSKDSARVLVIRPASKAEWTPAEVDAIIDQFGGINKVLLSSLNYTTVKKATSYKPRPKGHCLRFTGFPTHSGYGAARRAETRRVFSRLTWETVEVDFNEGGFYMPLERFTAMHNGRDADHLDDILNAAKSLNLMTTKELDSTFGFNEKDLAATKNDPKWVNLFEHLAKKVTAEIATGVPGAYQAATLAAGTYAGVIPFTTKLWPDVSARCSGAFLDFVTSIRTLQSSKKAYDVNTLNALAARLGVADVDASVKKTVDMLKNKWRDVLKTYPMLSLINWEWLHHTAGNSQLVLDYIATVDAEKPATPILKVA